MPPVLFNDAALEGQFASLGQFSASFREVMNIQNLLKRRGMHLSICSSLKDKKITPELTFQQWVFGLPEDRRTAVFLWIANGPWWDKPQTHPDEFFTWDGDRENTIVTYAAPAEAAFLIDACVDVRLVTVVPSRFTEHPIIVWWERKHSEADSVRYEVPNYWTIDALEDALNALPQEVESWDALLSWVEMYCPRLILSPEIKKQLGLQFIPNVANRCQILLGALNEIAEAVITGKPEKFQSLRALWMEGDKARMTDAGPREKQNFTRDMTFTHPKTAKKIVCYWHGKIKTPQYRIHYEWPLSQGADQLFIGYIGPKISKD